MLCVYVGDVIDVVYLCRGCDGCCVFLMLLIIFQFF